MDADNRYRHKNEAIRSAGDIVSNPFLVFDTETTGLDSQAEIVEISCISSEGLVLLDTLVQPTCPVPDEASAIHGIRNSDLVYAPTLPELLPSISCMFAGQRIGSYNIAYDTRLLNQSLIARGYSAPVEWCEPRWFCIMELYAQYWGAWHDYWHSYTWQKLENALEQCELTVEGPLHRALADARGALAVLRYMASSSLTEGNPG